MKDIYYICGPLSGIPYNNHAVFAEATNTLRGLGLSVYNPAEMFQHESSDEMEARSWNYYMAKGIARLADCSSIVLLSGWSKSQLSRTLLGLALSNNMRVYYYLGTSKKRPIMEIK